MSNTHNSEYEEPELVRDVKRSKSARAGEQFENFAYKQAQDHVNGIKNQIILTGWLWIIFVGLAFFAVLGLIVWVLSLVLPALFVIFITLCLLGGIAYVARSLYEFISGKR